MKEITLQVPEGKKAEWVNGVLTLVDEQPKDITERIKTFEDACEELGKEHPLVKEYWFMTNASPFGVTQDLIAYLKLRIIVVALNEGWEPKFTKDEYRYYPWLYLYTKEHYDKMYEERKGSCFIHSKLSFMGCDAGYDTSSSSTGHSSRLALRTRELAAYAGRQFTEEWADFLF